MGVKRRWREVYCARHPLRRAPHPQPPPRAPAPAPRRTAVASGALKARLARAQARRRVAQAATGALGGLVRRVVGDGGVRPRGADGAGACAGWWGAEWGRRARPEVPPARRSPRPTTATTATTTTTTQHARLLQSPPDQPAKQSQRLTAPQRPWPLHELGHAPSTPPRRSAESSDVRARRHARAMPKRAAAGGLRLRGGAWVQRGCGPGRGDVSGGSDSDIQAGRGIIPGARSVHSQSEGALCRWHARLLGGLSLAPLLIISLLRWAALARRSTLLRLRMLLPLDRLDSAALAHVQHLRSPTAAPLSPAARPR